jgi:hypothetical protein
VVDSGPGIASPADLGVSVARDGTGGLVYMKGSHVFASSLSGGTFHLPVQVDAALAGSSSQPVIAAGSGGLLLVAFINAGRLYVVSGQASTSSFGAPAALAANAANPAISITLYSKAYVAFTVAAGGGDDVRTAYYNRGGWALEAPSLNVSPGDNAGTGNGRPAVAAAGDGVAVVVWGENGHVYSRRVWGTSASVVSEQADASPGGCVEAGADQPVVATGGDSSYAEVAFRELASCGGPQQSRVLMNRLHGSVYDGLTQPDGLAGSTAEGADDPKIAEGEYGHGWVTSERTLAHSVSAGWLDDNGQLGPLTQVNHFPAASPPDPVPAKTGLYPTLIVWQQAPGSAGVAEIRMRYATDGPALGGELVLSAGAQGPSDAADGLAADGDAANEAAVAWLQGRPGATQLMAAQLYQPPGSVAAPVKPLSYAATSRPPLAWSAPTGWGPITYTVLVDGATVAETGSTSVRIPARLRDGIHHWRAIPINPVGEEGRTRTGKVFVDTVAPKVSVRLRRSGLQARGSIAYVDLPPPGRPRSAASGVTRVLIDWGDGTRQRLPLSSHTAAHTYRRAGRHRVSIIVSDQAGNARRIRRTG